MEGASENHYENNSNGVIAAIHDMTNAIRGQSTEDEVGRVMRIQREFRHSQPPIFKGTPEPLVAEE